MDTMRDEQQSPGPDWVECAICATASTDVWTPAESAVEIPHHPGRDGLPWRRVYACPQCVEQGAETCDIDDDDEVSR